MSKVKNVAPFLKWVGGKRQLLAEIREQLPNTISRYRYFEPFIGGGATFFALQPRHAVINDYNPELINAYRVIRDNPELLIQDLRNHVNTSEYYYEIRNLDRDEDAYRRLTDIQRASRIIYLNKTCYNGLYRVNSSGQFNVPYGSYKNPNIVNETIIRAINKYLNNNDVEILNSDYADVLRMADRHSFIYLDPPYHPISNSSNFTSYVQGGWNANEQLRLRDFCNLLTENHTKFLLSNSDCPFIREIYDGYNIIAVQATRAINSNGNGRGAINELLIKNY